MSLKKLYSRLDERSKGEVFYGQPLVMDADEINQFHKDLANLKATDIKEVYRADVREFLTSSLITSSASAEEIKKLDCILRELQEDL